MDRLRRARTWIVALPGRAAASLGRGWRRLTSPIRSGWARATGPIRRRWRRLAAGVRDRVDAARGNPRVAIGWAAAVILVVAWIGWAIYVTAEHGGAAGVGVLISWPAAIAALALVAAPFVGLWLLVKRLRPDGGGPPIAGGAPDSDGDEEFTGSTYPG